MTLRRQDMCISSYIGGEWLKHEGVPVSVTSPADRGREVSCVFNATEEDVKAAVDAATRAWPRWRRTSGEARANVLFAVAAYLETHAQAVASDLSLEEGKTFDEASHEVRSAVASLRFFGGEAMQPVGQLLPRASDGARVWTERVALGPVACIAPWNFPLLIPTYKVAPAIAYGNTVVLKPSSRTPKSAYHLTSAFAAAGAPAGVMNTVFGSSSVVGNPLVGHDDIRAISFTGSNEVGSDMAQRVAASKPLQLELGGKNAALILADADIRLAARDILISAFGMAGERCTAISRAIVVDSLADAFADALVSQAKEIRVGNPLDRTVTMGPVISGEHRDRVLGVIQASVDLGASLLTGGGAAAEEDLAQGYFVQPTILEGVSDDSPAAKEEIFGPVLSLFTVPSSDAAVDIANATRFGLTAAIFTRDIGLATEISSELDVGVVHINRSPSALERFAPFGGVKESGRGGREQGTVAREFFTEWRTTYLGVHG